ncbi:hypothetical protein TNCV_3685851 [Trichonephila clavipes]|nr:hypothetical protein TNCV_3685851 [Trichonephila clavipes]
MYIKSTACYSYVRDKEDRILTSLRQLQIVASGLNDTPGLSTLVNESYLRGRCKELIDHEKQDQNVKLGGHQTCLSINRLWNELCDMLSRLVGITAPGHHDCSIQE